MIRTMLATALVAGLVGCSGSFESMGKRSSEPTAEARLAAYVASSENAYPRDMNASDELRAAAVVNRKDNTIRIYNFTNAPLQDVKLWVNQGYVRQLDTIPANGSKRVTFGELYNDNARTFAGSDTPITSLQLQTQDGLFNLQGPAYE